VTSIATGSTAAKFRVDDEVVAMSAAKGIDIKSIRFGVLDTAEGTAPASSLSTDIADPRGLDIPGTLMVAGLEFNVTAVSRIPTEPLLNQARTHHPSIVSCEAGRRRWK
jgi:hypothetical protein